ncbi:hypothetical protein E2320_006155 [Naja naja]|nr:hypothetical protein E2320_006155 [Naja naja]
MRIIYRMRGLLGDATEEFIESLDSTTDEEEDEEEVYKMAGVMAQCGGLGCMLNRLTGIKDFKQGRHLLTVLLKLFSYCVKVKVNRQQLVKMEMNTLNVMLGTLNLALVAEQESKDSGGAAVAEQVLSIMEIILDESNAEPLSEDKGNLILTGDKDQLVMLLDQINSTFVRSNPSVLQGLLRIIPYLSFGETEKMEILVDRFKPYCSFDKYDEEHSGDDKVFLDCFCKIAAGIKNNSNGHLLKDLILQRGITQSALDYMKKHIPSAKNLDADVWKKFLSRPALPFILRLLRGLATQHPATQALIGTDSISNLHKLEQVSSDEGIGTLAENLLEALREHPDCHCLSCFLSPFRRCPRATPRGLVYPGSTSMSDMPISDPTEPSSPSRRSSCRRRPSQNSWTWLDCYPKSVTPTASLKISSTLFPERPPKRDCWAPIPHPHPNFLPPLLKEPSLVPQPTLPSFLPFSSNPIPE